MTWLTVWTSTDGYQRTRYAAHQSEAAAEEHAADLTRSGRAAKAVAFWKADQEWVGWPPRMVDREREDVA